MAEKSFHRFSLSDEYDADCDESERGRAGQIYHVRGTSTGRGKTLTPIARYFCWRPSFVEGFNGHWRVDCFVKEHALAPKPLAIGQSLVQALMREQICLEPIWLSVHQSEEISGGAFGQVFEED
jgi:hypothetical protein